MSNPFLALTNPAEVGQSFASAFDMGMQRAQAREARDALAGFAKNPADPNAAYNVLQHDPQTGARLLDLQADEAQRKEERQFNSALGRYGNALLGGNRGYAPQAGMNALAPNMSPSPQGQGSPVQGQNAGVPVSAPTDNAEADDGLSMLGQPQTEADSAFIEMMRIDPLKAMKVESEFRDRFASQLEGERKVYDWAITRFAGIDNDQDYQAARAELADRLGPMGQRVLESVPPRFPGKEALDSLRLRALDAKDQITHFQRQANIDADNARADRDVDDRAIDRRERRESLDNYRREQNDIRRNKPAPPSRARSRAGSSARPTATGPGGEKVEWNGKAWVPVR